MVDPHCVELREHLLEPGLDQPHGGTGIRELTVMRRVEDRVMPGLTFGVRTAGRCAHQVAPQEERVVAPGVLPREPHLEITVEAEAEPADLLLEGAVLVVGEKLCEAVELHLRSMPRAQLPETRLAGGSLTRTWIPEAGVEGRPCAAPGLPGSSPVLAAEGVEERVAFEPLGVSVLEVLEAAAQLVRVPALEAGERLPKQASMRAVHEAVGDAHVAPLGPLGHDPAQRIACQQAAPRVVARDQAREGDGEGVAREDGSLVGRCAPLPGLALRAELDAIEAQVPDEPQEVQSGLGVGGTAPRVLLLGARETRVLDSKHQVPDVEALERLADAAAVGLIADHGRPS